MKRAVRLSGTVIASALSAAAQCSMCRTAVSASGNHAGDTLDHAIIILLVPAVAMFGTIFLAVCHYGGSGGGEEDLEEKPEE